MSVLQDAMEGRNNDVEIGIDWTLVTNIIKLLFVLCFKQEAFDNIQAENHIEIIKSVLGRSIKENVDSVIQVTFRLLTFFMDSIPIQHQLLDNHYTVRSILELLPGADDVNRKFYLSCLSDLFENPRALLMMQNTSWSHGIETLLNTCLHTEPLATSLIFNRLHKD